MVGGWEIGLAAAALGVLFWPRLAEARRTVLLVSLAAVALAQAAGGDLWRFATTPEVRAWNLFHYVLAPKYFGEVGYFDLYPAALLAQEDPRAGSGAWSAVDRVRDQHSYQVVDRAEALTGFEPAAHFTPERWAAFQRDTEALAPLAGGGTWRNIFRDRGYNGSPFWTVVARPLTHLFPVAEPWGRKALASLDLLLLALAAVVLTRTFGGRAAAMAGLVFALSPVEEGRLVGGFLQYDWLAAVALGLAAWRRGRPATAGVLLAYATLERVFPLFFAASLLLRPLERWVRTGRLRRADALFGLVFTATGLLGLGLGCLSPRGPAAWGEWAGKIRHHSAQHALGEQRVGLRHLMTSRPGDVADSPRERAANLERHRGLYWGLAGLLLVAWGLACRRRRGAHAALLGLVPFFVLTVASRYYWSALALVPLLARPGPPGRRRARAIEASLLGALGAFYAVGLAGPGDAYSRYLLFGALVLGFLVLFLGWSLAGDGRALRRRARAPEARGTVIDSRPEDTP